MYHHLNDGTGRRTVIRASGKGAGTGVRAEDGKEGHKGDEGKAGGGAEVSERGEG